MKKFIFLFLFICSGANSAQLVGSEITLCTNGYSADGSTCTPYSKGDCDENGYYELTPSTSTFMVPKNNICASYSGYGARTLEDVTLGVYYRGSIVGSEITLCTNGYSADGSTCTEYQEGDCPAEYYGVNAGTTSFAVKNGTCASGYKQYIAEDSCGFELTASTCISFCNKGELTTGVGACSTLCGAGATLFRTSTGLRYPLWATKGITPSLNVGFANGEICYMNLTDEPTSSQSVWFQWDNNKLHATK